jgi:hypothetical protein
MDKMKLRMTVTVLSALSLSACASHTGRYAPACIAYSGSHVTLNGDSFLWERFTDQVRVDDEGNVLEPYPDFPKRGSYSIDGQTLVMRSEGGATMDNMYLHRANGGYLLLTADDQHRWEKTGQYADCVLTLETVE